MLQAQKWTICKPVLCPELLKNSLPAAASIVPTKEFDQASTLPPFAGGRRRRRGRPKLRHKTLDCLSKLAAINHSMTAATPAGEEFQKKSEAPNPWLILTRKKMTKTTTPPTAHNCSRMIVHKSTDSPGVKELRVHPTDLQQLGEHESQLQSCSLHEIPSWSCRKKVNRSRGIRAVVSCTPAGSHPNTHIAVLLHTLGELAGGSSRGSQLMKLPHKNQQGELAQGSSRLMKPYKKHRKSKVDSVLHPSKAPCSSGTGVNCNKKELHVQQAMVMQASTLQESASDILKQSVAKVRNSSEMVIQSSGKMKQPSSACLLHGSDLLIAPPTPEKSQKRQRTSQCSMCHIDLPQELVSEAQSHPTSLANGTSQEFLEPSSLSTASNLYCNGSTHAPLNPTTDKGHENIFYVKDSESSYVSRGKADSPVDVLQLVPQDHMESLQAATGQCSTAAGLHQSPSSMASNFYSNNYEDESDFLGNGHRLNAGQSNFFIEWVPANCIARLASLIGDPDHISKRSNGLAESWTQVQAGLMEPPFLRDMHSTGVVGSDVSTSLFNVPRSFSPGLSTAMTSPPPPPQLYHANCRNHVQGSSCLLPPAENYYNIENFSSSQQLSVKNTLGMQNTFSNTAASMSLNTRQISTGRGGFPSTHLAPSHGDSIPAQTLGGLLPHHQRGTTHGHVNQDGQVDVVGALFSGRADDCPLLESQGEEVYAFNVNEVSDVQQQATISNVKVRKKYTPKVAKDKLHCCHRQQPHGMDCQPKKKKFTCGRNTGFKRTTISTSKDGAAGGKSWCMEDLSCENHDSKIVILSDLSSSSALKQQSLFGSLLDLDKMSLMDLQEAVGSLAAVTSSMKDYVHDEAVSSVGKVSNFVQPHSIAANKSKSFMNHRFASCSEETETRMARPTDSYNSHTLLSQSDINQCYCWPSGGDLFMNQNLLSSGSMYEFENPLKSQDALRKSHVCNPLCSQGALRRSHMLQVNSEPASESRYYHSAFGCADPLFQEQEDTGEKSEPNSNFLHCKHHSFSDNFLLQPETSTRGSGCLFQEAANVTQLQSPHHESSTASFLLSESVPQRMVAERSSFAAGCSSPLITSSSGRQDSCWSDVVFQQPEWQTEEGPDKDHRVDDNTQVQSSMSLRFKQQQQPCATMEMSCLLPRMTSSIDRLNLRELLAPKSILFQMTDAVRWILHLTASVAFPGLNSLLPCTLALLHLHVLQHLPECEKEGFSALWQHIFQPLSSDVQSQQKSSNTSSLSSSSSLHMLQLVQVMMSMWPHIVGPQTMAKRCSEPHEQRVGSLQTVPYASNQATGELVCYNGPFLPIRKRRPRPKVVLDSETMRVWNLLMMGGGPSRNHFENDETSSDTIKELKWEQERHTMKAQAETFICRMHLVQGDRSFSQWKGSVVDSVVGAFLTQNVSDVLSSSAFMCMRARFPCKGFKAPSESEHDEESWGERVENGCSEERVSKQLDATASPPPSSLKLQEKQPACPGAQEKMETIGNGGVNSNDESYKKVRLSSGNKSNIKLKKDLSGRERARLEECQVFPRKPFDWEALRSQFEVKSDGRRRSTAKEEDPSAARNSMNEDGVDWEAVRLADVEVIAEVIKERGFNWILAGRIKAFLERIRREHGGIDLEWLRSIPTDDAKEFLMSVRGLGLKSVECIRLLTLHHLAFPVDTNVGRICVRLGWVPLEPLPEQLQLHLLELYPVQATIQKYLWPRLCTLDQETLYELHYQMITFGKVFCTKNKPNCNACPMKTECKHFASALSSAKQTLPTPEKEHDTCATLAWPQETSMASSMASREGLQVMVQSSNNMAAGSQDCCEPFVEEPMTPESDVVSNNDIEDCPFMSMIASREIDVQMQLEQDLQNPSAVLQLSAADQDLVPDVVVLPSQELMLLPPEAASKPRPKLKNIGRLQTIHYVYELPDHHPLLEGMDVRETDDPCCYLLAIWSPEEVPTSLPNLNDCNSEDNHPFASSSVASNLNSVKGTLLVPCRTAMHGSFPLNGTYFQVNEVFADHASSLQPIVVPRTLLWNLRRRFVFFGTSVTSIFRGMTTQEIQACFWRGMLPFLTSNLFFNIV
ncbi:unnamed protein product [Sphagnum tenellum]